MITPPRVATRPGAAASVQRIKNVSLGGGSAGLAIFYAYLAETEQNEDYSQVATRYVLDAATALSELPFSAALYDGFVGVGWALEHLKGRLPDCDGEELLQEIDSGVLKVTEQPRVPGFYDIVSGLVGQGIYALQRLPRRKAARCLEQIVDRLDEMAEHQSSGVTWFTPPEHLPPEQVAEYPDGMYNLGMAHGVPGIISLLSAVHSVGAGAQKTLDLFDGAIEWLLAQRLSEGSGSTFPYYVGPVGTPTSSRLGWCYGDPAVAAALLNAGRATKRPAWEQIALNVAVKAAQRPANTSGVVDACLCHGAAGVGHLFNRMYQMTGHGALGEAARFWFEQTLALRVPGRGSAGYAFLRRPSPDGTPEWENAGGLVVGTAGIGLALLAACTPVEPLWDRLLMVSAPFDL